MAELRARRPQGSRGLQEGTRVSGSGAYVPHPRPPRRSNRQIHISISLLILVFFVIYAHRNGLSSPHTSYEMGGRKLPMWTAICSKEGRKIYTVPVAGGLGEVECVVVNGKYVVDTGSLGRVRRKYGDKKTIGAVDQAPAEVKKAGGITIIYLPAGHTMTPGLTDSHGHPLEYGHSLQLPLAGTNSLEEVISRVEHFVAAQNGTLPPGMWIEGMGWDQNRWPVKEFPTAADLEASPILKGLPISLARIDVHAQWVSPAVLAQLGDLPDDVEGGQIVRDGQGKPTGIFIDNAMDLVNKVKPPWTDTQREIMLNKMMDDALKVGLTGVHDASVPKKDYEFYRKMASENKLRTRFYSMVYCEDREFYCGDDVERIDGEQGLSNGRLRVKSVKLFADGALGSRGAALLEDYSDQPGWKGFLLRPEEEWKPLIQKWYEAGWQVNVHAIGDRANKVVIDAMEHAIRADHTGGPDRWLRIEHAQVMRPEDLERAAKLGIIASFQPPQATSDMGYAEDRLGAERIKGAYAFKTYMNHGGKIALGSDFPVETLDPLRGFYAAVSRKWENGDSPHGPGGWYSEQKLSREEALRGYTTDAAHASFSTETGSLTPGMRFDAVVWDDDLLHVPESEMLEVEAKATILDGEVVYGRLG